MSNLDLITHLIKTAESHGAFHTEVEVDRNIRFMHGYDVSSNDELVTIKFRIERDETKEDK